MAIQENKRKELEHILNKENFVKIAESIKMLRNESPFNGAIALLVSYYNKSSNDSIKRLIREFLNDLKDQSSCIEVIAEIRKDIKPETLRMVISSCWQSGLNYADHSADFASLFITGDYMTAIECFTVIESSVTHMTRAKKNEIIKIIRNQSPQVIDEKAALALELISILK
jgi:hypothetical protein